MECTQRIECTQELCANPQERIFPEQIGFLGICGTKYSIRKGPNKIGRDPETCDIVLNLNSVSRQHAVINILNSKEYMIMDLGSANKTKLLEKTLQPYIAHPLKNGDTVQFGQIFGVFRLLEDETDLPMTQALDIPDTPIINKHASKLINFPNTVIPESPDASDKDDSFVAPSQSKNYEVFKSPSQKYIKSFGKTIAIQPIGSKQIDNIYWNSSKKSISIDMNLDESDTDVPCHIKTAEVEENIHEMETQIPSSINDDDLYSAETQLCDKNSLSSNKLILKTNSDTRPEIEMDMFVENKENNNSIYNADTQQLNIVTENETKGKTNSTGNVSNDTEGTSKARLSISDEEILFQEVDMEPLEEDFASQPLLFAETVDDRENLPILNSEKSIEGNIDTENKFVEECENKSEGSTDCDDVDMLLTQKIPYIIQNNPSTSGDTSNRNTSNKNQDIDEDSTDCEDDLFDHNDKVNVSNQNTGSSNSNTLKKSEINTQNENKTSETDNLKVQTSENLNFEDMLTQVVEVVDNQNEVDKLINPNESSFEDLPTQVIPVATTEEKSPFKVPFQSVKSIKRKEMTNNFLNTSIRNPNICDDDEEKFYSATQDVLNDLCTQREINTENLSSKGDKFVKDNQNEEMDVDNELRLTKQKSTSSLSSSDVESTPDKSQKNLTFMITEPPNSQEIVKSITFNSKPLVMESFSDSEDNLSEQSTPILFHKRKRIKNTKLDLAKKFELESLPSRTITRKRKPTAKVENNSTEIKNTFKNILAPKIFGEPDEIVDKEIIEANISRIKNTKNMEEKKKLNQNESTKSAQTKQDLVKSEKVETSAPQINDKSLVNPKDLNSKKSRTDTKPSNNEGKKTKSKKKESINLDSTKQEEIPDTLKTDTTRQGSARIKRKEDNKSKPKKDIIKVCIIKDKGKRTYEEKQDESPEKEVRRSKRQKIKKEIETEMSNTKKEERKRKTRSNKKVQNEVSSHYEIEKSIIYRLSDESRSSSPRSVKSSLKDDVTTNINKSEASSERRSLRRTALKTNHKVLFTAFSHPDIKILYNLLEKLNAVIVTDVNSCTVVVTVELKRTFKLLCAVGLGKPIVGKTWIQARRDANMIVDPWLYLLKDEPRETRFDFELARTLTGKRNFLKGYNITSTPNVEPQANEMKLIVECSGGTWKEGGSQWVCVSTIEDKALWPSLKRRGAIIVNPEFILGGVLRQKIDLKKNILS
ncbi:Mediator of DNA damage checkpoint protein 1 [Papilio machaon]|uniref:Mediator of DNA damage checkpoint protein 1 n=1 Tax=Papilio machaon TaxID=76193 RepID=A0A0N0PCJ7_PAPMA|nr:Mediator of DNA damage checkpoint protein 1 [Papilio machaon]